MQRRSTAGHRVMLRSSARWSLTGAETVLRLRALRTSDDFDDYWQFISRRSASVRTQHATRVALCRPAASIASAIKTRRVIGIASVERALKRTATLILLSQQEGY